MRGTGGTARIKGGRSTGLPNLLRTGRSVGVSVRVGSTKGVGMRDQSQMHCMLFWETYLLFYSVQRAAVLLTQVEAFAEV